MSTRSIILFIILLGVMTGALLTWVDVPDRITITVQSAGRVLIAGEEMSPDEMESLILGYVEDDDQVEIVILAGESVQAGEVLMVMDSARKAGAINIEIVTDASLLLNTP